MKYQYFKTKQDRYQYLGNRYFRVDFNADSCLQICYSAGDVKKGKANNFGVYLVSKLTFFSNYLGMSYVIPCTKQEFEKKYELMVKMLK